MKFNDFINNIKPDTYMQSRLDQKVSSYKKPKLGFMKPTVSIILASVVIVSTIVWMPNNTKQLSYSSDSSNTCKMKTNSFTLIAYAADNNSNATTPIVEINSFDFALPIGGKITNYAEIVNNDGDSAGISFNVTGENIKNIKIHSEGGELYHTKAEYFKLLDENSINVVINRKIIGNTDVLKFYDDFKKAWSNGTLDSIKNEYFKGKSTDWDDYDVSYPIPNEYTSHSASANSALTNKNPEEITATFSPKSILSQCNNFDLRGTEVTFDYTVTDKDNKRDYNCVNFFSQGQTIVQKTKKIDNLPNEKVAITVTYNDNTTETKTILISYGKDGEVLAQLC